MTSRSTRTRRFRFGAMMSVTLAFVGCGSSSNGTSSGDSGMTSIPDTGVVRDTGVDTSVGHRDAVSLFADTGTTNGPDATVDAPTDTGTDAAPSDTGSHDAASDVNHVDGGSPVDAHVVVDSHVADAGCVQVTVPTDTTGLGTCAAPVSGTCGPGDVSNYHPTAPPPTAFQNKCTMAQIQSIYNGCLATTGSDMACTAAATAATACYNCIFTLESDTTSWGPIVSGSDEVANINVGGCVTLLEPCNQACGAVFEEDLQCEQQACSTNCPYSTNPTAYGNCATAIDNCAPKGCATYYEGTACQSSITGPATVCFANASNFEAAYLAVVPLFCGG